MRSDLLLGAMKQVPNRYLLVKVLAKATRECHRPGARIEDTTNDVLARCGRANPIAVENALRDSPAIGLRRDRVRPAAVPWGGAFNAVPVGKSPKARSGSSKALVG
jgi:hypothetical protein